MKIAVSDCCVRADDDPFVAKFACVCVCVFFVVGCHEYSLFSSLFSPALLFPFVIYLCTQQSFDVFLVEDLQE